MCCRDTLEMDVTQLSEQVQTLLARVHELEYPADSSGVCCNLLQRVASCCIVLLRFAVCCSMLQYVAVCCVCVCVVRVLQCVAVYCACVAVCCSV